MTDAQDDTVTVNHAATIALFLCQEAADEAIRVLEAIEKHGAALVVPIALKKLREKSKALGKELHQAIAERPVAKKAEGAH